MKTGQVIGSTDSQRSGSEGRADPLSECLATVYQNLGIDPHSMVYDVSNRPNPIMPSTVQTIGKLL